LGAYAKPHTPKMRFFNNFRSGSYYFSFRSLWIKFRIPFNLTLSANRILTRPDSAIRAISQPWSGANLNSSRRNGTVSASARKATAPPVTHHRAYMGMRKVFRMECFHERLAKINPRLPITILTKATMRATVSPYRGSA